MPVTVAGGRFFQAEATDQKLMALIANRQIFPLLTGLEKDDEQIRCFGRFGVSAVNRASPQPLSSTIAGATNDFHR